MDSLIYGLEHVLHFNNNQYHYLNNNNQNNKNNQNGNEEICKRPKYRPDFWNNLDYNTREYTNCYSYAFDRMEINADKKLQPGELSIGKFNSYDCNEILDKLKHDYNTYNIIQVPKGYRPPCNHYKIALVIDDKGEEQDYHFYRQDEDGYWSHKPGKEDVRRIDASGNLIKDPETADRNYDTQNDDSNNESDNNYYKFCGYYSVPYEGGPFKRNN
jgi:hypothetical protein